MYQYLKFKYTKLKVSNSYYRSIQLYVNFNVNSLIIHVALLRTREYVSLNIRVHEQFYKHIFIHSLTMQLFTLLQIDLFIYNFYYINLLQVDIIMSIKLTIYNFNTFVSHYSFLMYKIKVVILIYIVYDLC